MEHRLGKRFPLHLQVEIWQAGKFHGKFVSRDVSHGGIFLKECDTRLQPGEFVYLKVRTHLGQRPQEYLMKAMAVHCSDGGIGFMWAASNQNFHREIESVRNQSLAS